MIIRKVSLLDLILFLIIKVKRSKKYRNFKEFVLPRYLMINKNNNKRECVILVFLSVLFLVLTLMEKMKFKDVVEHFSYFLLISFVIYPDKNKRSLRQSAL